MLSAFWTTLGLLSIPFLVTLNGLFVAAEFALVAVRRTRVEEMIAQGTSGARTVEYALINLDRSIAATQLGITLASISLGWVGEPALARLLQPAFDFLPMGWSGVATHTVASVIAFMLITFLHSSSASWFPRQSPYKTPRARLCGWPGRLLPS
jgi:CBS domain containing-hemolysin-like protein